ncbi:GTPase-activating protein 8 [Paramecium bursaria]
MLNTQRVKETFKQLNIGDNKYCFDGQSTIWNISIGYGPNISFVRSIDMDSWTDNQLNMMVNGGNRQLKDFFISTNVFLNDKRFKTNAAHFYREKMRALINSQPDPEPPQDWAAIYEPPIFRVQPQAKQPIQDNVTNSIKQTSQTLVSQFQKMDEKIGQSHLTQSIKKVGTDIKKKTAEIGSTGVVLVQEGYEQVKHGLENVWDYVKSKIDKPHEQPVQQQVVQQQSQPVSFDFFSDQQQKQQTNQQQQARHVWGPEPVQQQNQEQNQISQQKPLVIQNVQSFDEFFEEPTKIENPQIRQTQVIHDLLDL